jgi:hypothetical protein
MAIVGKAPQTGLSTPAGKADAILEKAGKVYCKDWFAKRYEHRDPDAPAT